MQRKGVDPNAVQFLEIPFPQMADALFQNRLDAVWNVEPFLTFMLKSGDARVIAYPYQENIPGMDIVLPTRIPLPKLVTHISDGLYGLKKIRSG